MISAIIIIILTLLYPIAIFYWRKRMKYSMLLSTCLLMILYACNSKQAQGYETKILDYKFFKIEVPKNWQQIDVKGIDSFVGEIAIDSTTHIFFDLGWYSNNLEEGGSTDYYRIDLGNVYVPDTGKTEKFNNTAYWKYFGKADSATIEKVKRQTTTYFNLNGYKVKLVKPKITGKGATGIYIDSLWKAGDNNDRFMLAAKT